MSSLIGLKFILEVGHYSYEYSYEYWACEYEYSWRSVDCECECEYLKMLRICIRADP